MDWHTIKSMKLGNKVLLLSAGVYSFMRLYSTECQEAV